jgi:hypothetical protein
MLFRSLLLAPLLTAACVGQPPPGAEPKPRPGADHDCVGESCRPTLVASVPTAIGLAVARGRIYWSVEETGGDEGLWGASVDGTGAQLIAPRHAGDDIAADESAVYWVSYVNPIMTAGPRGEGLHVFTQSAYTSRIAITSSRVFWIGPGGLFALGRDEKGSVRQPGSFSSLAADENTVYLGGRSGVTRIDLASGAQTPLATGLQIDSIAVQAGNVFFSSGTGLMKVYGGGGAPKLIGHVNTPASPIAVDDSGLYWLEGEPRILMRVGLDGSTPIRVATDLPSPPNTSVGASRIALDATHVYFINGSVFRIAKP